MIITVYHVYRRALSINADIYHFHDPELLTVGMLLKIHGKHVVYDMHEDAPRALMSDGRNYIPKMFKKPLSICLELFENMIVRQLSAVVAATAAIGRRARTLNHRTIEVCNYPLLDELVAPREVPWSQRRRTVAYVGGIADVRGVYDAWLLAPATVHGSKTMSALFDQACDRVGFDDGAVHNPGHAPVLATRHVVVDAPPRRDSAQRAVWLPHAQRQFSMLRQRIETVFSVLSAVFDVQCPRTRSLKDVVCRISTHMLACTLS